MSYVFQYTLQDWSPDETCPMVPLALIEEEKNCLFGIKSMMRVHTAAGNSKKGIWKENACEKTGQIAGCKVMGNSQ